MGKKSTKTDKNIYFQIRDELNLTRAQAADLMKTVSESRLEKIEYGDTEPQAEDIIEMAQAYKRPDLINYYCAHECAIGRQSIPEVKLHSLSEITLKALASLNDLEKKKDRMIEITADGEITEDEYEDFARIQDQLQKISMGVEALKLWVNNAIANGRIDQNKLNKVRENLNK